MSNERKKWSVKDSDYAWDSSLAGMSNEDIAAHVGRTPVAVGVRLSNMKIRYGFAKSTTGKAGPGKKAKPVNVSSDKQPTLRGMFFVSLAGAAIGVIGAKVFFSFAI